jgi:flagellar biosynthetic protein FlhB
MASDRTEKPTPKRREDAKKKGQIARRPELPAAAGFLAGLMVLRANGDSLVHTAGSFFAKSLTAAGTAQPLTFLSVHGMMIDAVQTLAALSLPVIGAAITAGLVGNFSQGGFALTPGALIPKPEKFSPISNLKRVFGSNAPVELVKSILKISGLGLVCYGVLGSAISRIPSLVGLPASQTFVEIGSLAYGVGIRAGGMLLVLAALDYGYGWYKHEQSLKMTKHELRDEYKQQEGDPFMKSARKRAARALSQKRMAIEVPTADVIITNPTHFAVALRYDREKDAAPILVAKGADFMAKRIREIAKEHEIMIIENPPLARALYKTVDIGRTIPQEFFRVVAELLAYVYKQRGNAEDRA